MPRCRYVMAKMGYRRAAEIEEFAKRVLGLEPEDLCWLLSPVVPHVGHTDLHGVG